MYNFNPKSAAFHTQLSDARNALGLTQAELAAGLGISPTMVQRYETAPEKKNSSRPSGRTVKVIENFFASQASGNKPDDQGEVNPLQSYPLDALIEEIRRRGFKISLVSED